MRRALTQKQRLAKRAKENFATRDALRILKLADVIAKAMLEDDSIYVRERAVRVALAALGMCQVTL